MIVTEEYPKNIGIYVKIECHSIDIFCLIGREDKVISIRDKNYKLSVAETAFGAKYYIYGNGAPIIRTYTGATFVNKVADSTISLANTNDLYSGLPHAGRNLVCLGSKDPSKLSIKDINNYYWTSRFKKSHFGPQFKFLKTGEIHQNDNENKTMFVEAYEALTFLKYGTKVIITDEPSFKNKARLEISGIGFGTNKKNIYLL